MLFPWRCAIFNATELAHRYKVSSAALYQWVKSGLPTDKFARVAKGIGVTEEEMIQKGDRRQTLMHPAMLPIFMRWVDPDWEIQKAIDLWNNRDAKTDDLTD